MGLYPDYAPKKKRFSLFGGEEPKTVFGGEEEKESIPALWGHSLFKPFKQLTSNSQNY